VQELLPVAQRRMSAVELTDLSQGSCGRVCVPLSNWRWIERRHSYLRCRDRRATSPPGFATHLVWQRLAETVREDIAAQHRSEEQAVEPFRQHTMHSEIRLHPLNSAGTQQK
jgi:hypothetical protein